MRKSEKMDVSKLLRKSAGKSYLQFTFFTNFTSLYWGTITTKKSAGKNAGKSAGKSAGKKVLVKVIYDLRFLRILLHCIEVLLLLCTITTIVRAVVL